MTKFKNLMETESLDSYLLLYSYNSSYLKCVSPHITVLLNIPIISFQVQSLHCLQDLLCEYSENSEGVFLTPHPLPVLQLPNPFRSQTQTDNLSQGICCAQKRASDNSLLFLNYTRVTSHSIYQPNYDQSHDLASTLLSIFFVLFSFKTLITAWCSVTYLLTLQTLFQCLYESKDFGIFILQQTQCQEECLVEQQCLINVLQNNCDEK